MTRNLDFIVFGVPRSGTTAVSRYLSAVDEIHCGIERFHERMDHSTLTAPEDFLNLENLPEGHQNRRFSNEDIARKAGKIRIYGNKHPTYFYRLQGVLDEIGTHRGLLCYRDIGESARSYGVRAVNPTDSWPPGRAGLFAVGDMILQIKALARLERGEIMVVPYKALVADWERTMRTAIDFLAPDLDIVFNEERVAGLTRQKDRAKAKRDRVVSDNDGAVLTETDQAGVDLIAAEGVDELMSRETAFDISEVRSRLSAIADKLPDDPIAYVESMVERHENAATNEFFPRWHKWVTRGWERK
ncbi:MAG: sulfotransferase [Pseudomonadota bacterium]